MAKKDFKLNFFSGGQVHSLNLYTTKAEALKNESQGNNECFALFWNGETLYAATNDRSDYPDSSSLFFWWGGKIRYVNRCTIVQKTFYYDPENPSDVHDDYRTYTRTRTVLLYADPNHVAAYGSAQALYNARPDLFSPTPFQYTVPTPFTNYRWVTVSCWRVYKAGSPTDEVFTGDDAQASAEKKANLYNAAWGFPMFTAVNESYQTQEPFDDVRYDTYATPCYQIQQTYPVYDASKTIDVEY